MHPCARRKTSEAVDRGRHILAPYVHDKDAEEELPVSGDHDAFAYTIHIEHVEDLENECVRDASASAPWRYIHLDYGRPTIDAIGTLDIRGW